MIHIVGKNNNGSPTIYFKRFNVLRSLAVAVGVYLINGPKWSKNNSNARIGPTRDTKNSTVAATGINKIA